MEKLFIVGIDTLAGSNLAIALADRCEIDGAKSAPAHREARLTAASTAISAIQPNWVVYCGPTARCSWDWSDELDWTSEKLRLRSALTAAESCSAQFTLLSSDAACDGPEIFDREARSTVHSSVAALVRELEQTAAHANSQVVRTHLFGWSPTGESYAEGLALALADGLSFHACDKSYASPILATDFAELLWPAHEKRLKGIRNLAGAERTNQRQFAVKLAVASGTTFGPMSRTIANSIPEICVHSPRETSLDSRALQRELQMPLPLLRDSIERFVEQATSGHRERLAKFKSVSLEGVAA